MKKILSIFLVFTILSLFISKAFASELCPIKDSTSYELDSYIKDLMKISNNIKNEIKTKKESWEKIKVIKDYNRITNLWLKILNPITEWSSYFDYFNFFVIKPLFDNIPYPIMRDYYRITRQSEWLNIFLDYLVNRWYQNIDIENACKNIDISKWCDLKGEAIDILWELIQNNKKLESLYLAQIVDTATNFWDMDLILIDINNFKKVYNSELISDCQSWDEKWSFDRIMEAISDISDLTSTWSRWIQTWIEAWQMANGNWKKMQARITIDLSSNWAWLWLDINPVDKTKQEAEKWFFYWSNDWWNNTEDLLNHISKYTEERQNKKAKMIKWSISSNQESFDINTINNNILNDIGLLYQKEKAMIWWLNENSLELQWKIIKMHISLVNSINILKSTKDLSEHVCKTQCKNIDVPCSF